MLQARKPARQGRSTAAVRVRAWGWALWVAPLLVGACSSAASDSARTTDSLSGGGGQANGGVVSASGASKNSGSGGYSDRSPGSSSGIALGGVSASSYASRSGSGYGGMSAGGGASSASAPNTSGGASGAGGASYGGASSSSINSSKGGSSMGGAGLSSSSPGAGASGAVPSGGAGGGATGAGGKTAMGGGTSAGGRTTASSYPPSMDAGARDGGMSGDAGSALSCYFAGGAVTSTTYPSGLTLRKACSPYIVNSINVYDNGALTIEPGVTVKFGSSGALSVGVQGAGTLVASGSSSESITFTSQEATPTPGFWRGLVFGGGTGSGSKVAYAQITAAGQNRDGALVGDAELPAHVLTVDHLTIDKVGDGASGILALAEKSAIAITNSSFVDVPAGRYPISVYAASFSSIGTGNTYPSGSAIEVTGGTVDATVTWTNPGLPVVISGDLVIEGASSPVLTVGSGMTLKFASNVAVQVGRSAPGKIAIAGNSQARVTLTSLSSTPVSGSWAGLQIWDSGKATLSYADVRYGGTNNGDSKGNVTVESGASTVQLVVDHSTFSDSLGWGIYVPCTQSQNGAIITVDTNTTYASNVLGTKGPGLTC